MKEHSCKENRLPSQTGQIAVEYILLLSIAVVLATVITSLMVSRETGSEGFVVDVWRRILDTMGSDVID